MRTIFIDGVILLGVALAQAAGASPRERSADPLQGFAASSALRLRIPDASPRISSATPAPEASDRNPVSPCLCCYEVEPSGSVSHNAVSMGNTRPVEVSPVNGEVEATRTPLTGSEAAQQLRLAYERLTGQTPSEQALQVLTAHWAHETGNGQSMFNYNFGGIRGRSSSGRSYVWATHEGSGIHSRIGNGRFRAHLSAEEGAADYLSLLARKYPEALEAVERGDVSDFAQSLKRGGYFTGDEETYVSAVRALQMRVQEWGFDALGRKK